MKKMLKELLHYKVEGIESVINIGKKEYRFRRKTILNNALLLLNEKTRKLEIEHQQLHSKWKVESTARHMAEEQLDIRTKELEVLNQQIKVKQDENGSLKKKLETEEKTIMQLQFAVDLKSKYVESFWCTGWIEYWRKYFTDNYKNIEEKISVIKTGVDEESIRIIDLFLERNFYMMPIQKYADFFLYNRNKIFNDWELDGMEEGLDEMDIRQRYKLDSEIYLETPVFKYHCGVLLLPPEVQKRIKDKDIIDGGAFWGDSALVLQEYSPKSIHAFEPMTINFKQLCELKKRNSLGILQPIKSGLGDRCSEKTLYYHEMLSGASVVNYKAIMNEQPETHSDNIEIVTIDSYVSTHGLNVGLIKLDVEGSELEAIKGAIETICNFKPILLISVYHLPKDFFEIKPLLESLNLGYQFMFRKLVYHDPLTEVSLIAYTP
ncbi:FkbM family methyltransferase [Enterocloster aldenensis]|uniref:FkbM family methyltransferase n=1 Tax=Enterocloster aldenensis TaxID=358742 RepID=UPI003516561C